MPRLCGVGGDPPTRIESYVTQTHRLRKVILRIIAVGGREVKVDTRTEKEEGGKSKLFCSLCNTSW